MIDRLTKLLLALVAIGLFANACALMFSPTPVAATCYASDVSDLSDCMDDLSWKIDLAIGAAQDAYSEASRAASSAGEAASDAANAYNEAADAAMVARRIYANCK